MSSGNIYTNNTSTNQIITQSYLPDSGIPSSSTDYILPRQVGTGSTRGTQTIGVGNINIDGSNNQITITNSNTSSPSTIILGQQTLTSGQNGVATSSVSSSGAFGLSVTDSNNASINLGINASNNVELLFNDGSTNRLLIGQNSLNEEVVWLSATGVDVTTADPNVPGQLILDSNRNLFQIVKTDTITIPGTGAQAPFATGATSFTVVHNLGYIPSFSAFVFVPITPVAGNPPVSSWNQSFPTFASDSNDMTYNLQCGTDATSIYFVDFWANNGNTAPVQSFSVTYYLFTATA